MNNILNESFGKITKITGAKITIAVLYSDTVNKVFIDNFVLSYVSIGALLGTKLIDGRTLVLMVEEIYEYDSKIFISSSITISGIYDNVIKKFSFGTNSYPLIGENVFPLSNDVLSRIFASKNNTATIGTYIYDNTVLIGYNPDVLFGKHLGIYGNTGSGKTCTIVSIIQNYIRNNKDKNIKFIILDVNGEYITAFDESEYEYYSFEMLHFKHSILNISEYGRLFRASDATQFPALRSCITTLSENGTKQWDIKKLPKKLLDWIENNKVSEFNKNQLMQYLQTLLLRIDSIIEDKSLMTVINSEEDNTLNKILVSPKKVHILGLQAPIDVLDIVLCLLFKTIYMYKMMQEKSSTHINIVLEEAHRYLNKDLEESKMCRYYIDKLSREGRKFGIGLIISSQVPSMLSQEIVSQCNSVVMHKITSKSDMEFIRRVLRISNDVFYLQMNALEKQYAIVCGEAFPNDSIVKIHNAYPLPMSNDPVINNTY